MLWSRAIEGCLSVWCILERERDWKIRNATFQGPWKHLLILNVPRNFPIRFMCPFSPHVETWSASSYNSSFAHGEVLFFIPFLIRRLSRWVRISVRSSVATTLRSSQIGWLRKRLFVSKQGYYPRNNAEWTKHSGPELSFIDFTAKFRQTKLVLCFLHSQGVRWCINLNHRRITGGTGTREQKPHYCRLCFVIMKNLVGVLRELNMTCCHRFWRYVGIVGF